VPAAATDREYQPISEVLLLLTAPTVSALACVLWSTPALVCQLGRSITVADALILFGDEPGGASQPSGLIASLFGAAKRF
jgi:hypothetical protein